MKQITVVFRAVLLMAVLASLVACSGGTFADDSEGGGGSGGGSGGTGGKYRLKWGVIPVTYSEVVSTITSQGWTVAARGTNWAMATGSTATDIYDWCERNNVWAVSGDAEGSFAECVNFSQDGVSAPSGLKTAGNTYKAKVPLAGIFDGGNIAVLFYITTVGEGSGGGGTTSLPSAPTGVTATALSSNMILVTWNSVSGAMSYRVYCERGVYTVTGTSFTLTGLPANTTYTFYITAVNSAGESAPSFDDAFATTLPGGGIVGVNPFVGTWEGTESNGQALILTWRAQSGSAPVSLGIVGREPILTPPGCQTPNFGKTQGCQARV